MTSTHVLFQSVQPVSVSQRFSFEPIGTVTVFVSGSWWGVRGWLDLGLVWYLDIFIVKTCEYFAYSHSVVCIMHSLQQFCLVHSFQTWNLQNKWSARVHKTSCLKVWFSIMMSSLQGQLFTPSYKRTIILWVQSIEAHK